MLSLIEDVRVTPFSIPISEFCFEIKVKDTFSKTVNYSIREYLTEVSSSRLFLSKIVGHYYRRSYYKSKIQWLKYQINDVGERVKLPYLLFDEGLLYYYPTKEIVGVFAVEDKTLTLILDYKMVKEEKSLCKIIEHKSLYRDIKLLITDELLVENKFNFTELESSKFELFMEKIEIENENKSK